MRRPTHPDVTGVDTTSRLGRSSDAEDHVIGAGPSYVQSILFARRPTRRPIPGSSPGTTAEEKARAARAAMVRAPDTRPEPGSSARAVNKQERN